LRGEVEIDKSTDLEKLLRQLIRELEENGDDLQASVCKTEQLLKQFLSSTKGPFSVINMTNRSLKY
jgi:hypothetical protein